MGKFVVWTTHIYTSWKVVVLYLRPQSTGFGLNIVPMVRKFDFFKV